MNEITLLGEYGPDAPDATPEVLDAARARLVAEFSVAPSRRRLVEPRPALRRRTLLAAAAAVAVAAVGVGAAVLPGDRPGAVAPGSLTLVSMRTLEFPLALKPRPATLSGPRFSLEDGRFLAVYLGRDGVSDVYLSVSERRPADGGTARSVTVGGRPAKLYDEGGAGGPAAIGLTWERTPGQWVTLVGNGDLASEAAVFALAATVVDQPQPVPLRVRLAPQGWAVAAFKDDTILTLRGNSPDQALSVQVVEKRDPDLFHQVMGAVDERRVSVGGRDAQLIRATEFWFLQTEVPGKAVVNIQAPLLLTADQVVAIAEQVSVVRGG